MAYTTVFVVSDDPAIRESLSALIASAGLQAETFSSLEMFTDAVPLKPQGCLLLDARVCDITNPERLARLTTVCIQVPVLLLVDRGDVPMAVRAIKEGAREVLEKPVRDGYLLECIKRAAATGQETDANR